MCGAFGAAVQRFQELVPNAFFRESLAEIESTFLGPNVLRVCDYECQYSIQNDPC